MRVLQLHRDLGFLAQERGLCLFDRLRTGHSPAGGFKGLRILAPSLIPACHDDRGRLTRPLGIETPPDQAVQQRQGRG